MIAKYCTYPAVDDSGRQTVTIIQPGRPDKLEKVAYPLLPKVGEFVDGLKPDPKLIFVLLNALGASEFYGGNANADLFPEAGLAHHGLTYGHRTFLRGRLYAHHQNKDPTRSFGRILLSEWHPLMKRVELVVAIDREMASRHHGVRAVELLDSGRTVDVSMGSRVPFDGCTECLDTERYEAAKALFDPRIHRRVADAVLQVHRQDPIQGLAPTQKDYCECIRFRKGQILPDGTYVGMINDFPDFFDLSFVFIGADRIAKTMWNIFPQREEKAMEHNFWPGSDFDIKHTVDVGEGIKTASVKIAGTPFFKAALWGGDTMDKRADVEKEGDIVKQVTSTFANRLLPALEQREPDIPEATLKELAADGRDSALSTLAGLGVILKPREYSRITIICRRDPVVDAVHELVPKLRCPKMTPEMFRPSTASNLLDLLPQRSFHAPFLFRRLVEMGVPEPKTAENRDLFLDKSDGSYQDYRQQVLDGVVPLARQALNVDGLRGQLTHDVTKPGSLPVIYILKAHQEKLEKDNGGLLNWISEHPWLTASIVIPGMLAVRRHLKSGKV